MPYLIPLARSLSYSGAHQYDVTPLLPGNIAATSSFGHQEGAAAAAVGSTGGGGNQLLALSGDSANVDVDGNGGGFVGRVEAVVQVLVR